MSVQKAQKGLNYTIKLREAGTEQIVVDKLTANTATVQDIQTVKLESSGTAAANLGMGYGYQIENAAGTVAERARMDVVMTTAIDTAEDAEFQFKVASAGTVTKVATINKSGLVLNAGGTVDYSAQATNISLKDNTSGALTVKEGSNSYINVTTTDSSEQITLAGNAAAVAVQGRLTTTDGVASGTARVVGGLAYSNTAASSAITSTATETLFSTSYTIPANTLKAGTVIKMRWQGIVTAANSTDTFYHVARIGGVAGTALFTGTATDATANDIFDGETTIVIRTAGASGTMVASSSGVKVCAAALTASRVSDFLASTTIDTTAAQVIGVTGKFSTTSAGNSARLDLISVEIY